jgi:hypothetical protein
MFIDLDTKITRQWTVVSWSTVSSSSFFHGTPQRRHVIVKGLITKELKPDQFEMQEFD